MEFGKIEKVDLSTITIRSNRSPLTTKILSLLPGEAFTVGGVEERSLLAAVISKATKSAADGRKFTSHKTAPHTYQIIRIK